MPYHISLQPDTCYHIFSRAIGDEKLFRINDNYRFFLNRYGKYISPIAGTYAYCLLPNHFHFLIKVKSKEELKRLFSLKDVFNSEPRILMQPFSNLLNSYTKAFNKYNNRKGSLFIDYIRRVEIATNEQFCSTLFYIHKNPVHHGYCKNMNEWIWSSYHAFYSSKQTALKREDALLWFGGKDGFEEYHQQEIFLKDALVIE